MSNTTVYFSLTDNNGNCRHFKVINSINSFGENIVQICEQLLLDAVNDKHIANYSQSTVSPDAYIEPYAHLKNLLAERMLGL